MDSRKRGGIAVTRWVEAGRPADGLLVELDCGVYVDGYGQAAHWIHSPEDCAGRPCAVHAPSDHRMRGMKTLFRFDRHLMERTCPHGVGHPDPDDLAFQEANFPERAAGVHGCDGCCMEPGEFERRLEEHRSGFEKADPLSDPTSGQGANARPGLTGCGCGPDLPGCSVGGSARPEPTEEEVRDLLDKAEILVARGPSAAETDWAAEYLALAPSWLAQRDVVAAYRSAYPCPGFEVEPGMTSGCSCGGCDGSCGCPTCGAAVVSGTPEDAGPRLDTSSEEGSLPDNKEGRGEGQRSAVVSGTPPPEEQT